MSQKSIIIIFFDRFDRLFDLIVKTRFPLSKYAVESPAYIVPVFLVLRSSHTNIPLCAHKVAQVLPEPVDPGIEPPPVGTVVTLGTLTTASVVVLLALDVADIFPAPSYATTV